MDRRSVLRGVLTLTAAAVPVPASLTVSRSPSLATTLYPANLTAAPGSTVQFIVSGDNPSSYTFQALTGPDAARFSISPDGLLTLPETAGSYSLKINVASAAGTTSFSRSVNVAAEDDFIRPIPLPAQIGQLTWIGSGDPLSAAGAFEAEPTAFPLPNS